VGRLITPELWISLEAAHSGRGLVRVRIAPEAPLDIFAAVEQPESVRMLLFGLPSVELAHSLDVPQARGSRSPRSRPPPAPGGGPPR